MTVGRPGRRMVELAVLAIVVGACSQPSAATPSPSSKPTPVAGVPMPPPSVDPSYPPQNLPDLVALAERGADRRFIGMEAQPLLSGCNRAWMRVDEPAGLAPQQIAADLLKVSIQRRAFQKSCGAYIFGTTDRRMCNCYHGEDGYLQIDRGPGVEPAPGKMMVFFALNDTEASAADWTVVVDAPSG